MNMRYGTKYEDVVRAHAHAHTKYDYVWVGANAS